MALENFWSVAGTKCEVCFFRHEAEGLVTCSTCSTCSTCGARKCPSGCNEAWYPSDETVCKVCGTELHPPQQATVPTPAAAPSTPFRFGAPFQSAPGSAGPASTPRFEGPFQSVPGSAAAPSTPFGFGAPFQLAPGSAAPRFEAPLESVNESAAATFDFPPQGIAGGSVAGGSVAGGSVGTSVNTEVANTDTIDLTGKTIRVEDSYHDANFRGLERKVVCRGVKRGLYDIKFEGRKKKTMKVTSFKVVN